ncbi:ATP-binding cassette domain-containing protein [Halosimplex sp. TS25]|uniref:ATP-binding cassette domain-containing protein n=1 Tax=Halosimplex rarum TaxID=3396619 RepID=UPI0039EA3D24
MSLGLPSSVESLLGDTGGDGGRDDEFAGGRESERGPGATEPSADSAARATDRPLIEVDGISAGYGDVEVLDDVSLSVGAGEFVGLVGPNGAGKTTLLKAINGVLDPDAGSVRVADERVAGLSAREASRRVATVPQDTTVAFEFTVEDVVEMGRTPYHGRFSGDPDAESAVERALDRTETARFRDRSIASLSGGERQRVVLARALAQETPALVLDEPTASLDVNHQVQTLELVRDLVDTEGKAALAAIHDLDVAARFCDRLAVLADGDLLAVGPPPEVLTAEHLGTAFDTEAAVLPNPVTGTPAVTPLSESGDLDRTVHVVGTGAATARTIAALAEAGAAVTVGPAPDGDVAVATAGELAAETVTAPAFASLDAGVEARARDLLSAADAAVVVEPVAPALRALARDHPAVVRVSTGDVRPADVADATAATDTNDAVDTTGATGVGDASDPTDSRQSDARNSPKADSDGFGRPVDAAAAATPDTVTAGIRAALDGPVGADD